MNSSEAQPAAYALTAVHTRAPGRARYGIYGLKAAPGLLARLEKELERESDIIKKKGVVPFLFFDAVAFPRVLTLGA